MEMAAYICSLPQPALRTDKEAALRGFGETLDDGLKIEAGKFLDSIFDPETKKGLEKFINRQHPDRQAGVPSKTKGIIRNNSKN